MPPTWEYPHEDLGEPVHVDGSPVLRPVVPLIVTAGMPAVLGVIDSGSPISVANADLFALLGIDIDLDQPAYGIPLSVGGGFERTPVFLVDLELRPPAGIDQANARWSLHLGARRRWRLPFAVLLGQRGWFDSFPTRIDATSSTVELPGSAAARK
ncbi:MAG: hypothetical protein FD127_725 [Acidimicrobiaceae bacterium]|nr:MAG: hypothetical protein FD127_725 [Acidimicrobiaceae bacterium]